MEAGLTIRLCRETIRRLWMAVRGLELLAEDGSDCTRHQGTASNRSANRREVRAMRSEAQTAGIVAMLSTLLLPS
jgi:hypothetical protein